jgi:hypothetical protein
VQNAQRSGGQIKRPATGASSGAADIAHRANSAGAPRRTGRAPGVIAIQADVAKCDLSAVDEQPAAERRRAGHGACGERIPSLDRQVLERHGDARRWRADDLQDAIIPRIATADDRGRLPGPGQDKGLRRRPGILNQQIAVSAIGERVGAGRQVDRVRGIGVGVSLHKRRAKAADRAIGDTGRDVKDREQTPTFERFDAQFS